MEEDDIEYYVISNSIPDLNMKWECHFGRNVGFCGLTRSAEQATVLP